MANSRDIGPDREFATVDTDPGGSGYFTNPVSGRAKKKLGSEAIFFSVKDSGDVTVSLQFKDLGDTEWTTYEVYETNTKKRILDGSSTQWRVGVVDSAAFTSGSKTFGFTW